MGTSFKPFARLRSHMKQEKKQNKSILFLIHAFCGMNLLSLKTDNFERIKYIMIDFVR